MSLCTKGLLWLLTLGLGALLPSAVGGVQPTGQSVQSGPDAPQNPGRVTALRLSPEISAAMRLDGLLTEEFWSQAEAIADFRQQEPLEGDPATEPTEVRLAYDREFLYVGVRAVDSEPHRVVSRIMQRDRIMEPNGFEQLPMFAGDDGVAILLDPFDDNRNAYIFATNPNGAEFDALLADEGKEFNVDWRGVWEVAGTRTPEGWSAEFRIPLRTLRYPTDPNRPWGFNVFRIIRRKNELVLWRSWSRDGGGFHRVSLAGELSGFTDLPPPGRNLEVKPYVLGGYREGWTGEDDFSGDTELEMGLDLKTEVRPGLVLDLTLNTDFAQVEVDDEQVNLTRFDLFFPEKRDFFLENSGIFDFGIQGNPWEPPPFQMFFSRRVGIEEDEDEVVPILGGARLTGRLGGQTVGFLNVVTDEVRGLVPRENFSIARVKRDVGENSYVGLMATDRRSSEESNTVVGADGSFYLTPALNLQGWLAHTFTRGEGGDDVAYAVVGTYNTDRWSGFVRHMAIGDEAEVRSGFVERTDLRRTDAYMGRGFRPGKLGIRRTELLFGGNLLTGMRGGIQDWQTGPGLITNFESGDHITIFVHVGENRPDEEFELADTLEVPAGTYDASLVRVGFNTTSSRPLSLDANVILARFYGGTLRNVGGTLTLAPNPQVSVALGLNRNLVEVSSGDFTADIASVRASYAFSTRLTTNLLVQYNSLDEALTTNFRLNFIHRPGSDLFLVFTEDRSEEDDPWAVSDRGLVMKVTYLRRF